MADERDDEREYDEPDERETAGRTPGGAEPQTGEQGEGESQSADIPAGE